MPILRTSSAGLRLLSAAGLGGILVATLELQATPMKDLRPEYLLESWTKERGLPDNRVYAINKTSDGICGWRREAGWRDSMARSLRFSAERIRRKWPVMNAGAWPQGRMANCGSAQTKDCCEEQPVISNPG